MITKVYLIVIGIYVTVGIYKCGAMFLTLALYAMRTIRVGLTGN